MSCATLGDQKETSVEFCLFFVFVSFRFVFDASLGRARVCVNPPLVNDVAARSSASQHLSQAMRNLYLI